MKKKSARQKRKGKQKWHLTDETYLFTASFNPFFANNGEDSDLRWITNMIKW